MIDWAKRLTARARACLSERQDKATGGQRNKINKIKKPHSRARTWPLALFIYYCAARVERIINKRPFGQRLVFFARSTFWRPSLN